MVRFTPLLIKALPALVLLTSAFGQAAPDGNAPFVEPVSDRGIGRVLRARHELALREASARRLPPAGKKWRLIASSNGLSLPLASSSVTFDFKASKVTATGKLLIKNDSMGTVYQVYVLLERFPAAGLSVSGPAGPLGYTDLGYSQLAINLEPPLAPGKTIEITTSQTGVPSCNPGQLGVVPCHVSPELSVVVGAYWTPLLGDEVAGTVISPEQSTLKVTVPAGSKAAAAGLDAGITSNPDGTSTFEFQLLRGPYFGAGAYQTGALAFEGKQVRTFVLAPQAGVAEGWRQAAVDILTFHGQRFGPYGLPKLDIVEVHSNSGAAFGPMSAVFIPPQSLAQVPTHWGNRATLAHELGHQWFGGFIDLGEQFSPWLNEGFATFAEMEYTIANGSKEFSVDYGPTYRQRNNLIYQYAVLGKTDVPLSGEAIFKAPPEVYVAVTYDKGGLLVSMLRYLLGEAAFLAAMKRYREDHVTAKATVSSLAASVKAGTGKEVGSFLNAWATQPGYPVFSVEVLRSPPEGNQFVTQVKATASKAPHLPVQLDLLLADGTTRREQLPFGTGTSQSASFITGSEVLQVRFDPENQVVGRSHGALPGDIYMDGEIDGMDLVQLAWAMGRTYDPYEAGGLFPAWADLVFDGRIDEEDANLLLASFGKRSGEGGQP